MHRLRAAVAAGVAALLLGGSLPAAAAASASASASARVASPDPGPFRGLGTWVDAYDYSPSRQTPGRAPPITPSLIAGLPELGVRTLYLQVTRADDGVPGHLLDAALLAEIVRRAHVAGLAVVGWYLPTLSNVAADFADLSALETLRPDALALDIEWTQGVPVTKTRNRRLASLSERVRLLVGRQQPIGAIVYPAVQLEVLNRLLWPRFPYRRLARYVDVWLPMTYFTLRSDGTVWRDAFHYTDESVRRLRGDLGDRHAVVHVIGGIADATTPADYDGFLRAASKTRAVGYSMYDLNTTPLAAWAYLRVP
jgi:hypothetical protein